MLFDRSIDHCSSCFLVMMKPSYPSECYSDNFVRFRLSQLLVAELLAFSNIERYSIQPYLKKFSPIEIECSREQTLTVLIRNVVDGAIVLHLVNNMW